MSFFITNVLLIGAAGLGPKVPLSGAITVVSLAPPPASNAPDAAAAETAAKKIKQTGVASWYGDEWQGKVMARGQPFHDRKLTAAHRTLPLNTQVHVTDLKTGKSVDVTITDRGPYVNGRVIDLSKAAAKKLGIVKKGLAPVRITSVAPPAPTPAPPQGNTKVASLDMR
ncbi:MAG TPA: septal ring lytic transglycosylase RlpA family protein [Stellaceae bacterium]|nr:septal ring lytic transglycosylase RlpA family protein [Stellaceae bacterium]